MNSLKMLSFLFFLAFVFLFSCKNDKIPSAEIPSVDIEEEKTDSLKLDTDSIPALTGTMADTVVARMYLRKAEILMNSAQYDEALLYNEKALEIYNETVGELDTLTATVFNSLGLLWYYKGNYNKALNYHEKALEIELLNFGEQHPTVARSYNSLGTLWHKKGNYDKALNYYENALEIRISSLGKKHLEVATTYNDLGIFWSAKGNYIKASVYYEKALEIRISNLGKNHPDVASSYNNLGILWVDQGSYNKALPFHENALEIRISGLGKNHPDVANSYYNLGTLWANKGNYDKALICNENTLEIWISSLGEKHPYLAYSYNNLGFIWNEKGNYDKTLNYYEKALEIRILSFGKKHPTVATSYYNLGVYWTNFKNYDKALSYYGKALDIWISSLGENHSSVANCYTGFGSLFANKGNYNKALNYSEKALEIRILNLGKNHPDVANSYYNLGTLWANKGNYDKALLYHKKALEIRARMLEESHPSMASSYNEIGNLWLGKEKINTALNYYKKGINILQYDFNEANIFSNVTDLNQLQSGFISLKNYYKKRLEHLKNEIYLDSLKFHFQTILALEDYIQKEYSGQSTRQFYAAKSLPVYEGAISNLLLRNQPEELPYIFHLSEKTKSRFLAEKIQSESYTTTFGIPDSLREKEHDIGVDISYFEKKKFQEEYETKTPNDSLLSVYKDKIFGLKQERDELQETFKTDYADYYNLRYSQNVISIKGVQDSLISPNQALIEYFVGDSSIFTFTILKDTFYINEIKKDFPLEKWVEDMLHGIYDPFVSGGDDQECAQKYAEAAHQIYQKIFAPVDALLPDDAELIIVPDGVLGYVPFDALLVEAPETTQNFGSHHYLLKDHQISYAYSATLLKEMRYRKHRKEPSKNILAFAPSFGSTDTAFLATRNIDISNNRNWLGALQYNEDEVLAIDSLVGADVFLAEEATENRFTELAEDYRILHLSTHGKANDKVGDYSFLAFYEQDDSLENEWLYNRELYNLRLNADMVVLSACETGIGELQRGEGIISLARGFSYAGAKSIITTLWSVNDLSMKNLMGSFYSHLRSGQSKDAALRNAKLDFLLDPQNQDKEPFFWAGIIPVGDMSPVDLDSGRGNWWLYGLMGLGVMGFLFYYFRKK